MENGKYRGKLVKPFAAKIFVIQSFVKTRQVRLVKLRKKKTTTLHVITQNAFHTQRNSVKHTLLYLKQIHKYLLKTSTLTFLFDLPPNGASGQTNYTNINTCNNKENISSFPSNFHTRRRKDFPQTIASSGCQTKCTESLFIGWNG